MAEIVWDVVIKLKGLSEQEKKELVTDSELLKKLDKFDKSKMLTIDFTLGLSDK